MAPFAQIHHKTFAAEADRDLLSLSAKTRILQLKGLDRSTTHMRTLMIYLFLTGVHPTSVHLIGGCLMGVYLTGVYLLGVYLTGVYLTGVHLTGVHLMAMCLMGVH